MAEYPPPTEDLPIFDNNVFVKLDEFVTIDHISSNYLKFPIAQGAETLTDITVLGTSTFNGIETHNNTANYPSGSSIVSIQPSNNRISVTNAIGGQQLVTAEGCLLSDSGFNIAKYELTETRLEAAGSIYTQINPGQIVLNDPGNTPGTQLTLGVGQITFGNPSPVNFLNINQWTGDIASVNSVQNSTHYLGFFDNSATGSGKPQKTAGLSCNPSSNTITATTFSGSLSGNASSSTSISLTSDNTAGTYFLPFSKNVASNSALFVDNTTTPLTYDPSTSTLTCSNFNGSISSTATAVGVNLTTDDTSGTYYIPFSKTTTATGNALYMDNVNGPLTYNPSNGVLSLGGGLRTAGIDTALPTTGVCNLWTANTITNINIMGAGQTTGNVNIGATTATTGLCNIRPPLVLSRQLQTTNSATYPPSASPTYLGYTIQTLGTAFTTTAVPASTNTNLMSYAFTSANYGTYLFTAHVTMTPPVFTTGQALLAISNVSANPNVMPYQDLQSPNLQSGSVYLSITCVIPIYSAQTIYLVVFFTGSTGDVNNALTHFTYTRIA